MMYMICYFFFNIRLFMMMMMMMLTDVFMIYVFNVLFMVLVDFSLIVMHKRLQWTINIIKLLSELLWLFYLFLFRCFFYSMVMAYMMYSFIIKLFNATFPVILSIFDAIAI